MRKTFCLVLCVLLAASYLAWRLKGAGDQEGRTTLRWVTFDNPARREQVEIFNRRNPDLMLTLDSGDQHMEKIIVQCLAGVGPDLFDVAGRYALYGFVEAGIPLDLTDLAAKHGFGVEKTWPGVADALRINGRQYAFPCNVYGTVLFYNKAIFDKYNVPYPPRDWTWQEFADTGAKLTRKRTDGRGYECFAVMGLHWYEMVLQAGGTMYSADATTCTLNSPRARQAIRFYYDLIHKHHLMPTAEQQAAMTARGALTAGFLGWFGAERLAMVRLGSWGMSMFRSYDNLRGKIGACHLPYKTRKVCLVGAQTCVINRHTTKRDQAIRFLRYLTCEEYNMQVVRSGDSIPPIPQYTQIDRYLHNPDYPQEDFNDIFTQALQRGVVGEVSPLINPLAAWKLADDQVQLMLTAGKSPADACMHAARQVNRRIYHNLRKYDKFRKRYEAITGRRFDPDDPRWAGLRTDE